MLPAMKKAPDTEWLKEVDSKALICSIRCMDVAYQNFFKLHRGYPRFKAKYDRNQSYQTQQGIKYSYDRSKLFLPKLGWVKCIFSKKIEGKSRLVRSAGIRQANTM